MSDDQRTKHEQELEYHVDLLRSDNRSLRKTIGELTSINVQQTRASTTLAEAAHRLLLDAVPERDRALLRQARDYLAAGGDTNAAAAQRILVKLLEPSQ